MKPGVQITLLIAFTFIGLAVFRATADEPQDKSQPKLSLNEQIRIQAAKGRRTFGSLLQIRGEPVKKSWDRLPACHFPRISDRLEAYPTQ
jgi:hypothetical protein